MVSAEPRNPKRLRTPTTAPTAKRMTRSMNAIPIMTSPAPNQNAKPTCRLGLTSDVSSIARNTLIQISRLAGTIKRIKRARLIKPTEKFKPDDLDRKLISNLANQLVKNRNAIFGTLNIKSNVSNQNIRYAQLFKDANVLGKNASKENVADLATLFGYLNTFVGNNRKNNRWTYLRPELTDLLNTDQKRGYGQFARFLECMMVSLRVITDFTKLAAKVANPDNKTSAANVCNLLGIESNRNRRMVSMVLPSGEKCRNMASNTRLVQGHHVLPVRSLRTSQHIYRGESGSLASLLFYADAVILRNRNTRNNLRGGWDKPLLRQIPALITASPLLSKYIYDLNRCNTSLVHGVVHRAQTKVGLNRGSGNFSTNIKNTNMLITRIANSVSVTKQTASPEILLTTLNTDEYIPVTFESGFPERVTKISQVAGNHVFQRYYYVFGNNISVDIVKYVAGKVGTNNSGKKYCFQPTRANAAYILNAIYKENARGRFGTTNLTRILNQLSGSYKGALTSTSIKSIIDNYDKNPGTWKDVYNDKLKRGAR